jgi:RNA polymerase sigma-70 factor (ECF subfamily)
VDLSEFTDNQLMLLFAHGTRAAFDALYHRHKQRVFRLAVRMVGERADAEEILQEVFLRLARSAENWEPRAKLTTWIYRVTVNRCLTHRERQGKANLILLPGLETVPAVARGPYEEVRERELVRHIRERVAELSGPLAAAFTLCAMEGLSYPEAAEVLERPVGTVKTHVHRARLLLRRRLEKEFDRESVREGRLA